jgi:hypothetical protein
MFSRLTAGHCTDFFAAIGLPPGAITVSFDSDTHLSTGGTPDHVIGVASFATHPNFYYGGNATAYNDVGILRLASAVTGIAPVTLPPVNWLSAMAASGGLRGRIFANVGYGATGLDRSFASPNVTVTVDDLRRVSLALFSSLTKQQLGLLENTAATGLGGTCFGDSGGPSFPAWPGAPNYQVAVTTSGDPACRAQSRHQRLDTQLIQDWLHAQLAAG